MKKEERVVREVGCADKKEWLDRAVGHVRKWSQCRRRVNLKCQRVRCVGGQGEERFEERGRDREGQVIGGTVGQEVEGRDSWVSLGKVGHPQVRL